ncbi:MAG: leucine-rich repeat domain-containing protein, partial [Christensenellales bacterium]
ELVLPEDITEINNYAFYKCSNLTSVIIPDSVTNIGDHAFRVCTGLTSITIPDSVTSIGSDAFYACRRLVEVYNKSSLNITAGSSDYGYVAYYAKAVYTDDYISKLSTVNGYIIYTDGEEKSLIAYTGTDTELVLPEDITEINNYAFCDCSNLTSVIIPDSVTSIGDWAFYYCTGLTSVTYNGTKAQWNAISKGSSWNYNTGSYTIYCTDGTLSK